MQVTKNIARPALIIAILLSLYAVVGAVTDFSGLDQSWAKSHFDNHSVSGVLHFLVVTTGLLSLGFPRQIVAFLAGSVFGVTFGFIYAMAGAVLSCAIVAIATNALCGQWAARKIGGKISPISAFLKQDVMAKSMIIRLLPVGSNLLTNLAAGVLNIRIWPFVTGSAIGYMPQMAIFALMGDGVSLQSWSHTAVSIGLFIISAILSHVLYVKYRSSMREHDTLNASAASSGSAPNE